MIILAIVIILFIIYAVLVIYYADRWKRIPNFKSENKNFSLPFSIIIPARNEEENIGALLEAIQKQDYPSHLIEVIVVDDHSTDRTAEVVKRSGQVRLISLTEDKINSYKKKAIGTGIAAATNDWIVTTDADCLPTENWIATMAAIIESKKPVFIAAPVRINCNSGILEVFQAMDFLILQVITGAVVYDKKLSMCNGANIAYSRKVFTEVGGFSGIDNIASGDDMLLMYKIWKAHPDQVVYLKSTDAIVDTLPMKTWKGFFNQRIRWASKARNYQDKRIFPVLLLVYLFNLCFPLLMITGYWIPVVILWILKTLVELPLFIQGARFFDKRWAIPLFFFFQPLHIVYTIISGLFGQFGTYNWKGRKVK